MACTTGPRGGAVPANMGIVKAQVLLWEHDPFYSRPTQDTSYPLDESLALGNDDDSFVFEKGALSLAPNYSPQNMFIATEKDSSAQGWGTDPASTFDFVDPISQVNSFLPGGSNYSPDEFGHLLWIHRGSLYDKNVILRANEYKEPPTMTNYYKANSASKTSAELYSAILNAPRWEYYVDKRYRPKNGTSKSTMSTFGKELHPDARGYSSSSTDDVKAASFWPSMTTKQSRLSISPVHWTLEKWAPVWQGCDFFVIIRKGDKTLDFGTDKYGDPIKNNDGTFTPASLEFSSHVYKTMAYKAPDDPYIPLGQDHKFTDGITNQAFYLDKEPFDEASKAGQYLQEARNLYHFGYRPYILIEIGHQDPEHNYIIEIAHGRKPRLLHIAEYSDTPNSLKGGGTGEAPDSTSYKQYYSCRVLDEFTGATSAQLLSQQELLVSVKNHLGQLIVKFGGFEDVPWVIQKKARQEGQPDESNKTSGSQQVSYDPKIFMVVPFGKLRIHGGNISCSLNFGFTQYKYSGTKIFDGQSVDTHQFEDEDLYVTASSFGNTDPANRQNGVKELFAGTQETNDRLGDITMSYTCDAYLVSDCIKNKRGVPVASQIQGAPVQPANATKRTGINIYKYLRSRVGNHGKGLCRVDYTTLKTVKFDNRLVSCVDGDGHVIRLYNAQGSELPFRQSTLLSGDGDGTYVSTWKIGLDLVAGDVKMGSQWFGSKDYVFSYVLTPILEHWRLQMTGDHKPTEGLEVVDISPLVTKLTDSWTVDDEGNTFNHEMSMTCYLPKGTPMGYNWRDDPEQVLAEDCDNNVAPTEDLRSLVETLYTLHDRAFYVTVKYWWGHTVINGQPSGVGYQRDPDFRNSISGRECSPRVDDSLIQMTGICYGGQIEIANNKVFMQLQVKDYMDVLKKQFIFNSPFFDGSSAHLAIYELAKMAGFDDCTENDARYKTYFKKRNIDRRPLGFLQKVLKDQNAPDFRTEDKQQYYWNGERSRSKFFRLPITYASLANPAVRFPNGEAMDNCMKTIAGEAGDFVYFDRYGVLRYEVAAGREIAYISDATVNEFYKPKMDFFTSPLVNIPASDDDNGGSYDMSEHQFEPDKAAHLVYNAIKYSRDVESCFNQLVLATAIPSHINKEGGEESGFYYLGHCFYDQLFDPNKTGFLGFRKAMFVSNGVYGGKEELKKSMMHYAAFSIPTSRIQFETFGIPCLKTHDIITVDGNLFYITEISHDIEPNSNKWWMTITAEWMRPFRGDLGLYKDEPSQ